MCQGTTGCVGLKMSCLNEDLVFQLQYTVSQALEIAKEERLKHDQITSWLEEANKMVSTQLEHPSRSFYSDFQVRSENYALNFFRYPNFLASYDYPTRISGVCGNL